MVKIEHYKDATEDIKIAVPPLPRKVFIPFCQHLGKACLPEVKPGDKVLTGQRIGRPGAMPSAAVHSSVTGTVAAIEDYAHPVLGKCSAAAIEAQAADSFAFRARDSRSADSLPPEELLDIMRDAGLVGMGGAGFPSFLKLKPPVPVNTLIVNGAECEPYLTSDYRLMLEKTEEIIQGALLLARILGAGDICVAVEDNKPQAISLFQAKAGGRVRVKKLRSFYPQGGEKQLIKSVLGREVPRGKLPFETGAVVHNVATVFAAYEAVYLGKPLYERVVTVSGDCLSTPANLLVRVGTPISELFSFCGPFKEEPRKIIIGGPMMGITQAGMDVPVTKTTSGVLVFGERSGAILNESACIRCGRCVRVCSSGLLPCMLGLAAERGMLDAAKRHGLSDCVECGACAYVCPANRRLVQCIKRAKAEAAR
ncbi:MAG: electron transport complex subunit RsxC [Candidatus Omnitrophota bacterium]|jgi:electron transport complex protein RnfC